MNSLKIVAEYSVINGSFSIITLDLLPKNLPPRRNLAYCFSTTAENMADFLHKAIGALSLDDEEPLVLPDSPQYRVFDENEKSLLGRLLNPECQSMERMIDYMPTAWRVQGRVRGIALSRDRFQFVFQREEDLATVLKDRPWSYNHWAMVLERWSSFPPENFLQNMSLWIRIRHIPADFFTVKTMFRLASEIGEVEEIAYDPEVSHTKDYIRAQVIFDTTKPLKETRKLSTPGKVVTIEFEYEKIHKRCFHCLRLTHEKIRCPMLRKGAQTERRVLLDPVEEVEKAQSKRIATGPVEILEGPPGFPPLFPELSKQDLKMAMQYISHSDPTERMARIERVRQGIEDNKTEASVRLTRISGDLDKGKGHVFSYTEPTFSQLLQRQTDNALVVSGIPTTSRGGEQETSSSYSSALSAPTLISTGFQLGPSLEGRASGSLSQKKTMRRRPTSWKRKVTPKASVATEDQVGTSHASSQRKTKRKSTSPLLASDNKNLKTSEPTVASSMKPLLPQ
ncbi:uncharacterized protein LOC125603079 [Brassica napus]|uniref:uncharacterized protein LOC125603079 n=1 Tax=Brassica napus TaxID=3708 RepID=UPI0020791B9C|nr:uncharacterized protein LOC125603079 [Brassica napus]